MKDLKALSRLLTDSGTLPGPLEFVREVGGGCINDCCQVLSGQRPYFLKTNSAGQYPGMFLREAEGLALLRSASPLYVPAVTGIYEIGDNAWLLMEYMEQGQPGPDFWEGFGAGLAALHRNTCGEFGLATDNYIGSLVQRNAWHASWAEFFLENRLVPQLETGLRVGWADRSLFARAEGLAGVVESEFPREVPALVHGDLWSGNYLVHRGGACLVDPAVHYGNRETELAFTRLFGGFHPAFYEAYEAAWPLEPDFNRRADLHNLYPLLVHANLFGGHYVQQCRSLLARF